MSSSAGEGGGGAPAPVSRKPTPPASSSAVSGHDEEEAPQKGIAATQPAAEDDNSSKLQTTEELMRRVNKAKAAFVPDPNLYERIPEPKDSLSKSQIYTWGIKLKPQPTNPARSYMYACMGSAACRFASASGSFVKCGLSGSTTSNALAHCTQKHGAVSAKAVKAATAERTAGSLSAAVKGGTLADIAKHEIPRFLALCYVKTHVVEEFGALGYGEKPNVRAYWRMTKRAEFPHDKLDRNAVKQLLVEMYLATADTFKRELQLALKGGSRFHLSVDLWVDKCSSLKYMGTRILYVNDEWESKTILLAVRQFNPSSKITGSAHLSEILQAYLTEVLEEFGLDVFYHLFSSTSYGGGGMERLCKVLLPGLWEWCVPHMLHCALVEALGTGSSKNLGAGKVLNVVMKTVEHVRKSYKAKVRFDEGSVHHYGKAMARVIAAPNAWSGVANVLETVLANSDAIESLYVNQEQREYPLAPLDAEIRELYSIIKPVANAIKECQATGVPTGAQALLSVSCLMLETLDESSALEILNPVGTANKSAAEEDEQEPEFRSHSDLTRVGRDTRKAVAEATRCRWFDPRYGPNVPVAPDYVFDMQMFLHPCLASQTYINALVRNEEHAGRVRAEIKKKFLNLVVELGNADVFARSHGDDDGDNNVAGPSPAKRQKASSNGYGGKAGVGESADDKVDAVLPMLNVGTKKARAMSSKYAKLGIVDLVEGNSTPAPPSLEEIVQKELDEFVGMEGVTLGNIPPSATLEFWKKVGARRFPNLARAARVLLGAPASAAVLERDFSAAGRLATSAKGTADAGWVEMIMFLNGNKNLIPRDIPVLDAAATAVAIPGRMRNPTPGLKLLAAGKIVTCDDYGDSDSFPSDGDVYPHGIMLEDP